MRLLPWVIWIAGAALELAIAVYLVRRRLIREFPIFSLYVAEHLVRTAVLFGLGRLGYAPYFYGFWTAEALDVVLNLGVIYEVYSHGLRRYDALRRLSRLLLLACLVALIGVAVWAAWNIPTRDTLLVRGVISMSMTGTIVRGGLLLFLFVFASSFGLRWKHYAFGIAVGLAMFCALDLTTLMLRLYVGKDAMSISSLARSVAFLCALLTWLGYLVTEEATAPRLQTLPSADLRRWNDALAQILRG